MLPGEKNRYRRSVTRKKNKGKNPLDGIDWHVRIYRAKTLPFLHSPVAGMESGNWIFNVKP